MNGIGTGMNTVKVMEATRTETMVAKTTGIGQWTRVRIPEAEIVAAKTTGHGIKLVRAWIPETNKVIVKMIGGISHGTMIVKMIDLGVQEVTGLEIQEVIGLEIQEVIDLGIQEVKGPGTKEVRMIGPETREVRMIGLKMIEAKMIGLRMKVVMMTDQIQHQMVMERLLLVIVSSAKLQEQSQVIFTPTQA